MREWGSTSYLYIGVTASPDALGLYLPGASLWPSTHMSYCWFTSSALPGCLGREPAPAATSEAAGLGGGLCQPISGDHVGDKVPADRETCAASTSFQRPTSQGSHGRALSKIQFWEIASSFSQEHLQIEVGRFFSTKHRMGEITLTLKTISLLLGPQLSCPISSAGSPKSLIWTLLFTKAEI